MYKSKFKLAGVLLVASLMGTICLSFEPACAETIQYDNGSAQQAWSIGSPYSVGVLFDNPLTPGSSYLSTVSLYLYVTAPNEQLQLLFLNPINNYPSLVPSSIFTPVLPTGSGYWETINVSSYDIVVGSTFLVGVHWLEPLGGYPGDVYLGFNTDSGNDSHGYEYNTSKWPAPSYWGTPTNPGDGIGLWMIRADVEITPLPAALPLFATGLGALGLLGWRRKRKVQAVAA